jgi:hypothetical protein
MGIRVPDGYLEVAYRHALVGDAEEMLVTQGFKIFDIPSNIATFAGQVADLWVTHILPNIGAEYTFKGVHLAFGPDGQGIRFSLERTQASTNALQPLPQNTAVLVRKNTGLGGRRNRGRMYIPGVPEGSVSSSGALFVAYQTEFQSDINNWQAANIALIDIEFHALFHATPDDTSTGVPVPQPAIAPSAVTSMTVQSKVATQRRRLRP